MEELESIVKPFKVAEKNLIGYHLVEQLDASTGDIYHTYLPYYENTKSSLFWPGISLLSLGKLYLCYELLF